MRKAVILFIFFFSCFTLNSQNVFRVNVAMGVSNNSYYSLGNRISGTFKPWISSELGLEVGYNYKKIELRTGVNYIVKSFKMVNVGAGEGNYYYGFCQIPLTVEYHKRIGFLLGFVNSFYVGKDDLYRTYVPEITAGLTYHLPRIVLNLQLSQEIMSHFYFEGVENSAYFTVVMFGVSYYLKH